jgi:hypothetical protein
MLIKNAHCNACNISDRRFVLFANGFGISILQPASTEGMVAVTVLGFLRRGLSVPVTNLMGGGCGFYRHHGSHGKLVRFDRARAGKTPKVFPNKSGFGYLQVGPGWLPPPRWYCSHGVPREREFFRAGKCRRCDFAQKLYNENMMSFSPNRNVLSDA